MARCHDSFLENLPRLLEKGSVSNRRLPDMELLAFIDFRLELQQSWEIWNQHRPQESVWVFIAKDPECHFGKQPYWYLVQAPNQSFPTDLVKYLSRVFLASGVRLLWGPLGFYSLYWFPKEDEYKLRSFLESLGNATVIPNPNAHQTIVAHMFLLGKLLFSTGPGISPLSNDEIIWISIDYSYCFFSWCCMRRIQKLKMQIERVGGQEVSDFRGKYDPADQMKIVDWNF